MGDDPDSGHPTPRDDFQETSTPVSSHRRVPLRDHFPTTPDPTDVNRSSSSFGHSPRSKASHTHADRDIRRVIELEREAMDKRKLEKSLHEENRHVQDLKFDLDGQNVALEETKRSLAEKEAEILKKTEEIGRLKQLTEQHQQKITEMQANFSEEKLQLQESNADLQKELMTVAESLEKARAELARLGEEKFELEWRMGQLEEENRLKINNLTSELYTLQQQVTQLSQAKTDHALVEARVTSKVEALETELAARQTDLQSTKVLLAEAKTKVKELEESTGQGNAEKQRLDKMQEKLSQEVLELKKELSSRPALNELERLQDQNRDLNSRLDDRHSAFGELETECSDLKRKLDNTKTLERELAEKTKLIEGQMKLITDLQAIETGGEKKIQELRDQFLLQQQEVSEKVLLLEQEKTDLHQRLTASAEEIKTTKDRLEAAETRLRDHDEEKAKIQANYDRLAEDLKREKKKIGDLESTIEDLAEKELQASGQAETIRKEFAAKQKEHAKMTDELTTTLRKLTETRDRVAHLEKAASQSTYDEKKHQELERLNEQLTKEIDYLRGETKTRPSRAEFQRLHDELELLGSELAQKNHDLDALQKDHETLKMVANSSQDLRTDLERKMQVIREQEAEITRWKSSLKTVNEELADEVETKAKIVEEFDRHKSRSQAEIDELVHKLETTNEGYRALHARMQQQEFASALGSSTVWELLPESLRKELPSNLVEALQSLRIDRHDVLSLADSQTSDQMDSCAKVADTLENFYRNKGRSSLISYNILQLTVKLLRAGATDSAIADFSQSIGQFIEKREKKLEEQIEEMSRKLNEERRSKFEYHSMSHKLELELDNEKRAAENLHMNITNLKAELGEARNTLDIRQGQLQRLQEEMAKLKQIEMQYKESVEALRQVTAMIAERDHELDEQHDEELRLHQRIRFAEGEAERLKREQEEMRTDQHNLRLENMNYSRRLAEADQKVSRLADSEKTLSMKLEHEVKVKRYNQETMRCCIQYMDQYKAAVEKLKERNLQRQQVLDKILTDLSNVRSKKELGHVAESNLRHLNEQVPVWKRADDEQDKTIREMGRNYNQMIRERSTAELRVAFQQVHQDRIGGGNKENQPKVGPI